MSDDERISMEELDAQMEMEAMEEAAEKKDNEKQQEEEEEEEEEQKEKAPRDDSDDNSEKSDEAIEDNEEPEVDGDSREPSDGESIDGESGEESESETEHEKHIRKSAALQFLDLEADEGTEKEIRKHLKKKIAADEDDADNAYEMDSIMDPEGVVVYDTDYEQERRKKKKKGASAAAEKKKKKKDPSPKKRKRIRSPSSSENEESDSDGGGEEEEEEQEEEKENEEKTKAKKKKAITLDVSDDEMEHMQTLGGTSSAHKVGGQAPRPKAAFHDHSDIAKAAAEKKSKKVSAASLLDSPKQKPKAKPTAAAAAANKPDGGSSSKSPAKKPRIKKAPTLQVGEQFELKERGAPRVYRVTFRGEDMPLVMGATSSKFEFQSSVFHPRFFTTAEALEEREDGGYDELDKFQLFFVSPGRAPKKVGVPWATSGWNTFNSMSAEEQYAYVIEALNNDNIVRRLDADGNNTKRMMFTEPLMQQIKSEAVLNPDGEWKWMPKHVRLPDLITPRDENGEPAVKAAAAAAAAGASGSNKKKPVAQAKPKIDRIKENNSHDVSAMLQKKAQQIKKEPPPPISTAAAASSSSSSSSKKLSIKRETGDSSAVLDFFAASPEPSATGPAALFGTASTLESTKELLAELIDMRHRRLLKMGYEDTAGDEINKSFTFLDEKLTTVMESDDNFENKCKAFDAATEKIKGLQLLLIALPFFNAEAAQMMREKLARM